jgi:hypothetical protein
VAHCATFEERLLARARDLASNAKYQYSTYTWASYILYTIGWTLSFVGKFYGNGASELGG